MANGANVNAQNRFGNTALAEYAKRGSEKLVKTLIDAGSEVNLKDEYGHTAVMLASSWGNVQCVELLIGAGADVNVQDSFDGTALMCAAQVISLSDRIHSKIVQILTTLSCIQIMDLGTVFNSKSF